jgi:hypothetical protein
MCMLVVPLLRESHEKYQNKLTSPAQNDWWAEETIAILKVPSLV